MAKSLKICINCTSEYESCPVCESMSGRVFAYRQSFCSVKCFKEYETNGGFIMRIIDKENLSYTITEYDLKSGFYTATNGQIFNEDDIHGFILNNEDYKKLKAFKEVKEVKKVVSTESEE